MKNLKTKNSAIKLFCLLDEGINDKNELIKRLHIKLPTFYKNIQKLKLAGFEIKNKNGSYFLETYKNILNIDCAEKSTIAYLLYLASELLPNYKYEKFGSFVKKFILLSNKEDCKEIKEKFEIIKKHLLTKEYEEKIKNLETYIKEKKKIKITLRSGKKLIIRPIEINWKKDNANLYFMNINKHQDETLNINQIVKIEDYNEKDYMQKSEEIIFELYGDLAKRYLLKKEERIVKNTKNSIIIASKINNKEALFRRLLRYDTSCKILFPKSEVNIFNNLIDKAIINLDSKNE